MKMGLGEGGERKYSRKREGAKRARGEMDFM